MEDLKKKLEGAEEIIEKAEELLPEGVKEAGEDLLKKVSGGDAKTKGGGLKKK